MRFFMVLFWQKVVSAYTLCVNYFMEISLSCIVSEINTFLCFTQKLKMATKNGGKTISGKKMVAKIGLKSIFGKNCHITLRIPCRPKISLKLLYLTPFLRYYRTFHFHCEGKLCCLVNFNVGHFVSDHFQKLKIFRYLYNKLTYQILCE